MAVPKIPGAQQQETTFRFNRRYVGDKIRVTDIVNIV
jgi:hypothetical protein